MYTKKLEIQNNNEYIKKIKLWTLSSFHCKSSRSDEKHKCNKNNHLQVTVKWCDKCRQWYRNTVNQRRLIFSLISHFLSLYFPMHCTSFTLFLLPINFSILSASFTSQPSAGACCCLYDLARPPRGVKAQQSFPNNILALPLEASSGTWMGTSMWKWGILGIKHSSHLWNFRGTLDWALRAKHGPSQIWSQHEQSKFSVRTLQSSRAGGVSEGCRQVPGALQDWASEQSVLIFIQTNSVADTWLITLQYTKPVRIERYQPGHQNFFPAKPLVCFVVLTSFFLFTSSLKYLHQSRNHLRTA